MSRLVMGVQSAPDQRRRASNSAMTRRADSRCADADQLRHEQTHMGIVGVNQQPLDMSQALDSSLVAQAAVVHQSGADVTAWVEVGNRKDSHMNEPDRAAVGGPSGYATCRAASHKLLG